MNEIEEYTEKIFEYIKHIDESGNEYWHARELMMVLEYKQWRYFELSISKAIKACNNSNYDVLDHFAVVRKKVDIGSKTKRNIKENKNY